MNTNYTTITVKKSTYEALREMARAAGKPMTKIVDDFVGKRPKIKENFWAELKILLKNPTGEKLKPIKKIDFSNLDEELGKALAEEYVKSVK